MSTTPVPPPLQMLFDVKIAIAHVGIFYDYQTAAKILTKLSLNISKLKLGIPNASFMVTTLDYVF